MILARWLDRSQTLRGLQARRHPRRVRRHGAARRGRAGRRARRRARGRRHGDLLRASPALLTGRWLSGVAEHPDRRRADRLRHGDHGAGRDLQAPGHWPGWDTAGSILSLGLLGTGVAYLIYFSLIQTAGATRAILVTYLVPAFALVYGGLFVDESITVRAVVGLVLILGGTAAATGAGRVDRWTSRRAGDAPGG